tara:strand:- start:832 stop:1299 length:468 start_codon:yes stop_codon:yes gene_type:complete
MILFHPQNGNKVSSIDICIIKQNKNIYQICSSNYIKWLSIYQYTTIPNIPNENITFNKSNRMIIYNNAKNYYNEQLIKDLDLKRCLSKVWYDEMYRRQPKKILNIYYKNIHNLKNNFESTYKDKNEFTNEIKSKIIFYERQIEELILKINNNYFI